MFKLLKNKDSKRVPLENSLEFVNDCSDSARKNVGNQLIRKGTYSPAGVRTFLSEEPVRPFLEFIKRLVDLIILFNSIAQFLMILNLFNENQISNLGLISILLAADNLLTKSFFGYDIFKIN